MGVPNFDYGGSYKRANSLNQQLATVLANAFYGLPLDAGCRASGQRWGRERTIMAGMRRKALDADRRITEYGIYLLYLYEERNPTHQPIPRIFR